MAKVLGLKQLLGKKFNYLEGLPDDIKESFGRLVESFIMIVWGLSGNGKTNLLFTLVKVFMPFGKVLYVSLEEGFEASIVQTIHRHLTEAEHSGKIEFADHEMTYDMLVLKLSKKKSPKFIFIDSLQYWDITYDQYKFLKEKFPRKAFIFISHADGSKPKGTTAKAIQFDSGIKVHVMKFVAFITSRYGGNKPYIIWEDGAKKRWGKKYRTEVLGLTEKRVHKKKLKPAAPLQNNSEDNFSPKGWKVLNPDANDEHE